ncbi:thioredoxin family protein [Mucilaginibacter segetis]|uniref:Thioredoxin family protein n=1 Tax=Mucilaginibacter segetis TaxID=2793071 RepID=A0A934PUI2_9SPHI|nr:thioredoxin fold domain-containing protein [Mucilaginibacter segetis]MBK0379816.1 thioredoxin family protein [Mucilaginibacter segetis]
MKFIIAITLTCFTLFTAGAQDKGIKFQNNLTWAQVKQKAKQENKYIFIDCYTTWCVPCKDMANDVFPQPEVANFFNDKFISVALQFDETKNDDADTKRWRAEVKKIGKEYKVEGYPTYLFFTPDGSMVHTVIGGSDANTFLNEAKAALDPKTQLAALKKQYVDGNRSPEFLKAFINALGMWNSQVLEVINVYLATQKDLLTKDNLRFIARATAKSTDPGFKVVREHSKEFDAVNGLGSSRALIANIAFDEVVLPVVRVNGAKVNKGGMYYYTGDLNKNVNWNDVKAKLDAQYPDMADEILAISKLKYYRDAKDWQKYTAQITDFVGRYGDVEHTDQINSYANDIFLFTDDKNCLKQALNWSKKTMEVGVPEKKDWYLVTYVNLLYKLGKKEEALAITDDAIKRLGNKAGRFPEIKEKMSKGEETW